MSNLNHEPQGETLERRKKRSLWSDAWLRMRRSHTAVIGMIMFALILITCYAAPLYIDYETQVVGTDLAMVRKFPAEGHLLGTDEVGRDILARIIWGGRTSITIALCATVISSVLGITLGSISAYYGGKTDSLIMRTLDIFMAIPSMLLATAIVAALGTSLVNVLIAIAISYIPTFARTVRAAVLTVKDMEYIEAARAIGCKDSEIITTYLIPNAMAPIIVQATMGLGSVIITESTLSFLGLGVKHPMATWGNMMNNITQKVEYLQAYAYIWVPIGCLICLAVIALTLWATA